jgi:hypothetical protein
MERRQKEREIEQLKNQVQLATDALQVNAIPVSQQLLLLLVVVVVAAALVVLLQ